MFIKEQITDPLLKPCPFCNQAVILVSIVQYPKGEDIGYKMACQCGWAARLMCGWESNKVRLIQKWNDLIKDADVV